MNAHKVETILSEDGTLMLQGLPFRGGDAVEVIILERASSISTGESPNQQKNAMIDESVPNSYPLRGTVLHYEDPFKPAMPIEDWEVLQ